ncbi:hypothetical protein BU17DRAFT_72073 [Hysterangium stoloniferum]|nr:hypothetical protein BU17DRAFT_72073 [Hysterangium stoloniferum]
MAKGTPGVTIQYQGSDNPVHPIRDEKNGKWLCGGCESLFEQISGLRKHAKAHPLPATLPDPRSPKLAILDNMFLDALFPESMRLTDLESSRDVEEMSESHRGMSQIIWSLKLWSLLFISDAETTTAMLCATSSTSIGVVNISNDIQADGPIESEKGGVAEPHSETVLAVFGDSPVDIPSHPPHTASLSRLLFTWSEGSLTSFKSPTQLQALEAIWEGKDHMMVVMHTCGGKSLLWQLPTATFLLHQVMLVVVPFVALKEDIQRYMGGLCEEWMKKTETVKGKVSVFLVSLE